MEVRLNKLISDSGLCSRREADKFIEEGRVTVNGSLPQVGQKVTEGDIVILAYIIHSGFISGYQNRYGDNLKPPTNVYHRMTA
nr:S4 domain-containing protein [Parabacteroides johnsonii]